MTQTQAGAAPPAEEFDPIKVQSAWLRAGISEVYNAVVVMMRKGGAGKTTTVLGLADALARFGLNVLIVDLDPQGNASKAAGRQVTLVQVGTQMLGTKPVMQPEVPTISEVIEAGEGVDGQGIIEDAILMADWGYEEAIDDPFVRGGPLFPGKFGIVGVVPAYMALENAATNWTPSDYERLANALLQPATDGDGVAPNVRWDVVLLDTPPGAVRIAYMAGMAAHRMLGVTQAEDFGADAIPVTIEMINDLKERYRHDVLEIIGLLFNEFSEREVTQREIAEEIEEAAAQVDGGETNFPVWPVQIPSRTVVGKSQRAQQPLSAFLGESKTREPARAVCQAVEAAAILLLESINHPEAAMIKAAWGEAWPPEQRTKVVDKVTA